MFAIFKRLFRKKKPLKTTTNRTTGEHRGSPTPTVSRGEPHQIAKHGRYISRTSRVPLSGVPSNAISITALRTHAKVMSSTAELDNCKNKSPVETSVNENTVDPITGKPSTLPTAVDKHVFTLIKQRDRSAARAIKQNDGNTSICSTGHFAGCTTTIQYIKRLNPEMQAIVFAFKLPKNTVSLKAPKIEFNDISLNSHHYFPTLTSWSFNKKFIAASSSDFIFIWHLESNNKHITPLKITPAEMLTKINKDMKNITANELSISPNGLHLFIIGQNHDLLLSRSHTNEDFNKIIFKRANKQKHWGSSSRQAVIKWNIKEDRLLFLPSESESVYQLSLTDGSIQNIASLPKKYVKNARLNTIEIAHKKTLRALTPNNSHIISFPLKGNEAKPAECTIRPAKKNTAAKAELSSKINSVISHDKNKTANKRENHETSIIYSNLGDTDRTIEIHRLTALFRPNSQNAMSPEPSPIGDTPAKDTTPRLLKIFNCKPAPTDLKRIAMHQPRELLNSKSCASTSNRQSTL
jgi:hypothetical protein